MYLPFYIANRAKRKLAIKYASKNNKEIKNLYLVMYLFYSEFLYRAPKDSGPCLSACIYGCNLKGEGDD